MVALALSLLLPALHSVAGETAGKGTPGMGALDGKVFVMETGDTGKKANGKDTVTFRTGKFHSQGCDQYGFGDAVYTTATQGDTVTFAAETTSPKSGKIQWEGTVRGDKIDVRYVWSDAAHWYKPNPKPLEKWGKGELKKVE